MYLADFRRRVAQPIFHLTDHALRTYQSGLSITESLRAIGMVAVPTATAAMGYQNITPATPGNVSMLTMAGLLRGSRYTIGDRVLRRWNNRSNYPGGKCPITHEVYFGPALAACVALPEFAAQVHEIQVCHELAMGMIVFAPDERTLVQSMFVELSPENNAAVLADERRPGVKTIAHLPGEAVREMSRLINRDPPAVTAPRRTREPVSQGD